MQTEPDSLLALSEPHIAEIPPPTQAQAKRQSIDCEPASSQLFKIGINSNIIDKPISYAVNQATGWINVELTSDELIASVSKGYAFSAHFRDSYRKTTNFVSADFLAADFDGTVSLDEALNDPFVKQYASFAYTTVSHSAEKNRFRVVFLLQETIADARHWANCLLGLAYKLNSDPAVADGAHQFYGNQKAAFTLFDRAMPAAVMAKLAVVGSERRASARAAATKSIKLSSGQKLTQMTEVKLGNGRVVPFNALKKGTGVRCPFHDDQTPSAFVVESEGAVSKGLHCKACDNTFWADAVEEYDFDAFDRLVEAKQKADTQTPRTGVLNLFDDYFPPNPEIKLLRKEYLPALSYEPGITLVRSPKGTGKTESLKKLVEQIREQQFKAGLSRKERPKSILLIGHRQLLIREAANKLGLDCYLDDKEYTKSRFGYAVCLDSIFKMTESAGGVRPPFKYDCVILDESEQVFGHLQSKTIGKGAGIDRVYSSLAVVIRNGKAVYALDADLGLITAHSLKALRPEDFESNCRIIVNKPAARPPQRTVNVFTRRKDMEAAMREAISEGRRCYIVSNSRKDVETIAKLIKDEFGSNVSAISITSDNSRATTERNFVEHIQTEILKYQVVISSPSLGTGIDISFPEGAQCVDEVFGFFHSNVNTHTDVDQQLSRVRNPGNVSVWFRPGRQSYETNFDKVKAELGRGYFVPRAVIGTDKHGVVRFDEHHPLLLIAAHVSCVHRASKKSLRRLFLKLRVANDWAINYVAAPPQPSGDMKWRDAQRVNKKNRTDRILAAADLPVPEFLDLAMKASKGEVLSRKQRDQLERGYLRHTYNAEIDRDLIEMDDCGRLRDKLSIFHSIFSDSMKFDEMCTLTKQCCQADGKISKMPVPMLVLLAMIEAGLVIGGQFVEAEFEASQLVNFKALCNNNRIAIEEILDMPLRDDFRINPIRQLNAFLGKIGLKLVKSKRTRRGGGGAVTRYILDNARFASMKSLSENFIPQDLVIERMK